MQDTGNLQPRDYTIASTLSGGLSGGIVALVTRGRRNVLPATIMWSLIGGAGQMTYNAFANRPKAEPKEGFWKRLANKSWSPVKAMSDEEYAKVLRERMLKVDVEIALLDDKIAALRKQQEEEQASGGKKQEDA
jgi:hypothetical protein